MSRHGRKGGGAKKGGNRRNENNITYACPLPILLEPTGYKSTKALLGLFGYSSNRIVNPHVEGIFDHASHSVWVKKSDQAMLLWKRGFFGKGNLSRSEPSWLNRQIHQREMQRKGGMTAEEITAKRRELRNQFKLDRARAIAQAAEEAEAAFAERGIIVTETSVVIPSGATWKPSSTPKDRTVEESSEPSPNVTEPIEAEPEEEEEEIKDIEHLQLTLQEAFFLIWTMDCLTVLDSLTNEPLSLQQIWNQFQNSHLPAPTFDRTLLQSSIPNRFDNPFLINYYVYHHYRSLGWVVKGGIKFCVDYLLYKRGPVFQHAEFAIVVCPVYEDPKDRDSSPFALQNVDPFTWSWLSTINRVNTQVLKTLILCYVTIPALERVQMPSLESPSCLTYYQVRDVIVRRFIPARMRD